MKISRKFLLECDSKLLISVKKTQNVLNIRSNRTLLQFDRYGMHYNSLDTVNYSSRCNASKYLCKYDFLYIQRITNIYSATA